MPQIMFPEDAKIPGDSALCGFGIYKRIEISAELKTIGDYAFLTVKA